MSDKRDHDDNIYFAGKHAGVMNALRASYTLKETGEQVTG